MSLPFEDQVFANTVSGRAYDGQTLTTSAQATGLLAGGVAPTIAFVCARNGSNVIITFDATVAGTTKSGANRNIFPAGAIPAAFRPTVNTYGIAMRSAVGVCIAQVLTDGSVQISADAANTAWADAAAVNLFRWTISYNRV